MCSFAREKLSNELWDDLVVMEEVEDQVKNQDMEDSKAFDEAECQLSIPLLGGKPEGW